MAEQASSILTWQGCLYSIAGAVAGDNNGTSVASAGDINQGSYSDVIIGCLWRKSYTGQTGIVYGGVGLTNIDLASNFFISQGIMISGVATGNRSGISLARRET